jgi:hypothetical protein
LISEAMLSIRESIREASRLTDPVAIHATILSAMSVNAVATEA